MDAIYSFANISWKSLSNRLRWSIPQTVASSPESLRCLRPESCVRDPSDRAADRNSMICMRRQSLKSIQFVGVLTIDTIISQFSAINRYYFAISVGLVLRANVNGTINKKGHLHKNSKSIGLVVLQAQLC